MNVNKAILIGRLGKKVEIKLSKNNKPYAHLSIATRDFDKSTTWHRVSVFNQSADYMDKYASVGDTIYVEGEIKNSQYKDKNGVMQNSSNIMAHQISIVDKAAARKASPSPDVFDPNFDQDMPTISRPTRAMDPPLFEEDFP